jgi:hypothetical protein
VKGRRAHLGWTAAGLLAAALIAVVMGVLVFRDSGSSVPSEGDVAQPRCEADVIDRFPSASSARVVEIDAKSDVLDADSRDLFSLLDPPLRGIDQSRIKVWNVAGVVESKNEFGDTMRTPFTCRAYFRDGNVVHTLVLLDHHH